MFEFLGSTNTFILIVLRYFGRLFDCYGICRGDSVEDETKLRLTLLLCYSDNFRQAGQISSLP